MGRVKLEAGRETEAIKKMTSSFSVAAVVKD